MINKTKLFDELTESFIAYQWRLENPMPSINETEADIFIHYRNDWMFHNKVKSMVSHVMHILDKHVGSDGKES